MTARTDCDPDVRDLVGRLLELRDDEVRAYDDLLWRHRSLHDSVEAEDLQAALGRSRMVVAELAEWLRWSE